MQQAIRPVSNPIHANITIPGSKSITNHALLLASLAQGISQLSGIQLSDDTRLFINALNQLGVNIQLNEMNHTCSITGVDGKFPKTQANIWCGNAGTAAQFLLAACANTAGVYYLDGSNRLRERPINQLLETLRCQGTQFIPSDIQAMPLTLIGTEGLHGGEINIDGSAASQILSALLMISPFARMPLTLTAHDLVNHAYVDMTCSMMAEFDVMVHRIHEYQFNIPVPQRYQARDYVIEPDFSIASYFFAAAAITGGEVTIQPTKLRSSKQVDANFLTILEQMGCDIKESRQGLSVKGPTQLRGIEVNMQDCLDTFITLAAIAPFANSPVKITHISRAKEEESHRIQAMKVELTKLGIRVETDEDSIQIFPGMPHGGVVATHEDHRMAMAFSLIGLKVANIVIDNYECVNKICPTFFKLWDELHGKTNIRV